jgi:hypothetical protein
MSRKRTGKRIRLTERDLEVFRLLTRYRFLRSTHLHALAGGRSDKRFVERLGDLYHEGGYIDRPKQQWQAINARYMPAVYELGKAGRSVLVEYSAAQQSGAAPAGRHGRRPSRHYHHELMICDILSSIEIGARADPSLRFISWSEILASPKMPETTRNAARPMAARVPIAHAGFGTGSHRIDRPLVPDALFGLEYTARGTKQYRFFALEADRNTEPIVRGNLRQSSYLRKILQYREIVARSVYKTLWGLPNLLVLNVTINDRHRRNIMRLVDELTKGKGSTFLLFGTMPSLASLAQSPRPIPNILTRAWHRTGHPDFFIDRP